MARYQVHIQGLEVYGFNGVTAEERKVGHRLLIDVDFDVEGDSDISDDVTGTLDYGTASLAIVKFLADHSFKTLERMAREVGEHLLNSNPQVLALTISIHKPFPPAPVIAQSTGVTLNLHR